MTRFSYARGRIEETLQFITEEMREFDQEYSQVTREEYDRDRKLQKVIEKTVENILTALIELCGTLLVEKGKMVENYPQILKECARIYRFTLKEGEELAHLAIERNRIVHRYLDIRWYSIQEYKSRVPLIRNFLRKVLKERKSELSGTT